MGVRRIRRCKACGRKFTPKNQNPQAGQVPEQGGSAVEQEGAGA